jgi:hypothetical protein
MSMTANILRSYRAPRAVLRGLIEQGLREPQVLFFGTLACALIFVAQWPALSRAAALDPSVTFEQRMGGALFGTIFLLPLILYGVAGVLQLALRVLACRAPGLWVRAALFWALLAVTPLMLLQAVLSAAFGPFGIALVFGGVVAVIFAYILIQGLREVAGMASGTRT